MRFTSQFAAPRINLDRYRKALDRHMREVIAQALAEWLEAVLREIPVWSGASRATFEHLAQTIGMDVPNVPVVHCPDKIAEGALDGLQSKLELGETAGVYAFTYKTSLPHLVWNEYHNANLDPDPGKFPPPAVLKKPGPYEFQAKGAVAFLRFAYNVDLPSVCPFIEAKKVKG
jgi:hypothetical protein